ncbi:phosphate ABC transporter permease PstA [Micrococcales bacterium 31B]|nr:phosphate ABC transporter permease PstA [Micrococcales bacterium 31B]
MALDTASRAEQDFLDVIPSEHRFPRWVPLAALAASFAIAFLVMLSTGSAGNIAGTVVLGVITYGVLFTVASRIYEGPRWAKDRLATTLVVTAFGLAIAPLVSLLVTTISNGIHRLNVDFLTYSMNGVFGGMDAGGAYHAIMGTLLITLGATVISVPIGMFTAIYLIEYAGKSKLGFWVRFFVDVMTGIPSIVAGLFAYAIFALIFGPAVRMGLIGSVALAVLMIPTVVRSSEEMLKLVPNELREAAYALGVPKWITIVKVVLPTALAGLVTGVTLAIARVIGETAPLLVTVGFISQINLNLFDGRMTTLPTFVYNQYTAGIAPCRAGVENCIATINYDRAWAAALTLIIVVMLLNIAARVIAKVFSPKVGH